MKVKFEMSKFNDFFFKTGNEYLAIKNLPKLAMNILPNWIKLGLLELVNCVWSLTYQYITSLKSLLFNPRLIPINFYTFNSPLYKGFSTKVRNEENMPRERDNLQLYSTALN